MKISEERKAHLPVNGIFLSACSAILGVLLISGPGYGSTDAPAEVDPTPVAIKTAALLAVSGNGPALASRWFSLAAYAGTVTPAASTSVSAFRAEDDMYAETMPDIGTADGAIQAEHPQCQDSCSL
jgi:hypothetical protein